MHKPQPSIGDKPFFKVRLKVWEAGLPAEGTQKHDTFAHCATRSLSLLRLPSKLTKCDRVSVLYRKSQKAEERKKIWKITVQKMLKECGKE